MRDLALLGARDVRLGHDVRLMPPAYVKPYVKRGKTDANDAEAICEAVTRPTMRFVAIKSTEQQAALSMHRARDLLVKQRTQLVNMIRGLLAEFGIDIPRGITHALAFARRIVAGDVEAVPPLAAKVVGALATQALAVQDQVHGLERERWPGIEPTRWPDASPPCRVSACWGPPPLPPPSPILASSDPGARSVVRGPQTPAGAATGAQAGAGRHRGHGQQGRPGDLGDHDPRRRLSRATGGLSRTLGQRRQRRASEVARAM